MTGNSRICPECGNQFTIGPGRGQAKTYCNVECTKRASRRRAKAARSSFSVCKVDGCASRVRSARAEYCELHYTRVRRNGHVQLKHEISPPEEEIDHSHGYVLEYAPGHWHALRTGRNRVYQHRRVYFDEHGEGPFACHWCDASVTWDDMHVDHVNAVKDDNRLENLVASCAECNQKRGKEKMRDTARARSKAKVTWNGETLTLGQWADRLGITRTSMAWRLSNGWDVGRALTEPRGVTGPPSRPSPGA